MESGLFMRTRQQRKDQDACPEITYIPRDQMGAIHKKCKELQVGTESTDSVNLSVLEAHSDESDKNFEEVQHRTWDYFKKELRNHQDAKGRDQNLLEN